MGVLDCTIVLLHVNLLFIFGLVASLESHMTIVLGELGVCSLMSWEFPSQLSYLMNTFLFLFLCLCGVFSNSCNFYFCSYD